MQVLSSSVSKALKHTLGNRAKETAKFAEMFDKFFDCVNVSNFTNGYHKRCIFKSPYRSASDFRLKVYSCTIAIDHSVIVCFVRSGYKMSLFRIWTNGKLMYREEMAFPRKRKT